ncbi:thiamine-phosphate kinase [Sphingopyxis yananensis]|uniref:thiamine-phosphate kinase n=1 Tax=Sphingopyxis yananensis TaxID=2886687 RepID=UPI001D126937|nr:thiamine-phosphate kinase [Sphingopyxis yananensis]MCC2602137.1 thiamine-phosphate kinase [Sphingopyxis yananensis]
MSQEFDFIARLRAIASDPAARGLADDAAVLGDLVMTHDMIVEGVHYLPDDSPQDIAWKLIGVNLSDLAAKGAKPVGVLMGYSLGDAAWDRAFADGLADALAAYDVPLLGGDTVRMLAGAPRALGLTALGRAPAGGAPLRSTMQAGDDLWVSGTIGDAGLGLALRLGQIQLDDAEDAYAAYARPVPRLALGQAAAPFVSAMMDVSDGLLIDTLRMAQASGLAVTLQLDAVPLSSSFVRAHGDGPDACLTAATAGEDFELLFSARADMAPQILSLADHVGVDVVRVGQVSIGDGLQLRYRNSPVSLPEKLGWMH